MHGGGIQVRSGFFVVKIFDKLRFVVKTSVLQIGFECSMALRPTDLENLDNSLEYNLTRHKLCRNFGLSELLIPHLQVNAYLACSA